MIAVHLSANTAEILLNTQFHWYRHKVFQDKKIVRANGEYSLPHSISNLVDFVGGVRYFVKFNEILIDHKDIFQKFAEICEWKLPELVWV